MCTKLDTQNCDNRSHSFTLTDGGISFQAMVAACFNDYVSYNNFTVYSSGQKKLRRVTVVRKYYAGLGQKVRNKYATSTPATSC